MVKLATSAILFLTTAGLSWTGYRAATAASPETAQAAVDPLSTDAAIRHRQCLPNHWRGYILQPKQF